MNKIRVNKCQWTSEGIIKKTTLFVTRKQFSFLDKKPVDERFSNVWFEEYPFKWYEFYPIRHFFRNFLRKMKYWYSKQSKIGKFLYDLLILVIGTIIVTAILKFVLKWI